MLNIPAVKQLDIDTWNALDNALCNFIRKDYSDIKKLETLRVAYKASAQAREALITSIYTTIPPTLRLDYEAKTRALIASNHTTNQSLS